MWSSRSCYNNNTTTSEEELEAPAAAQSGAHRDNFVPPPRKALNELTVSVDERVDWGSTAAVSSRLCTNCLFYKSPERSDVSEVPENRIAGALCQIFYSLQISFAWPLILALLQQLLSSHLTQLLGGWYLT